MSNTFIVDLIVEFCRLILHEQTAMIVKCFFFSIDINNFVSVSKQFVVRIAKTSNGKQFAANNFAHCLKTQS